MDISMFYNSRQGIPLSCIPHAGQHFIKRHGYGIIFIDRQMAIEVLYNNLKDKSKVLVDKRVVTVTPLANGVQVTTKDGATYTGDILVGADGVHSTIRKEMWRLDDELAPGRFPQADRTDVPCDYHCMFGISKNVIGLNKSSAQTVLGHNNSYLVVDGPGSRTYWFLFSKNERRLRGMEKEIPRSFTNEEEEGIGREALERPYNLQSDVRRSVYEPYVGRLDRDSGICQHGMVFGRTIITGDAVHKFNPISGLGGNNALETAATLTTELVIMLKALPPGQRPSDVDITAAFQRTQDCRRAPVTEAVDISHQQQSILACETLLFKVLTRIIIPLLGVELTFERFADSFVPARRLPMLPMPKRPRFEPFHDELPAKPLGGLRFSILISTGLFSGLLCAAVNGEHRSPLFLFPNSGSDPLQSAYLFPILVVWTLESYRNGNTISLVSFPAVFGVASQLVGLGIVAPIYFLLSVWSNARNMYARAVGRPIPVAVARTILPAVFLSLAVSFVSTPGGPILHSPIHLPCASLPVLVSFHTYIAKRLLELNSPPDAFDMYKKADVKPLRNAYMASFLLSACAHIALLFLPKDASSLQSQLSAPLSKNNDFTIFALATAIFCLHSVYELRRTGWATTKQALVAALAVLVSQPLVGPVAVYAAVWYWREGVWSQDVS
ncbi:Monooxygenase FAD-binding protein [Mycena sanguinolenta]|uniref:Monooxygenase FAD-binding protein n=1 Tax=Mycena sanguinolenta TaxID=230812 RepID=A0A8H7CUS2_9AGAR|nr:Monooxygenase FAD-binding protein [Mycena sanguinolenta]